MSERRTLQTHRPQLRSEGGKPKIIGYGAVFYNPNDHGTEYELGRYGNYRAVERLMPGCFDRAVKEDDCRALYNHDPSLLLGRSTAGTLRLSIDKIGLRYEIDAPDTTFARDLIESLKRGDVTGSSFSFEYLAKSVVTHTEANGSETDVIEVRDVTLYDVGPVTFPAYKSTTSGLRSSQARSAIAMRLRCERVEADLAGLSKRFADANPTTSRRTRRDRIRDRCNKVVAEIERDGVAMIEGDIERARELHRLALLARRK